MKKLYLFLFLISTITVSCVKETTPRREQPSQDIDINYVSMFASIEEQEIYKTMTDLMASCGMYKIIEGNTYVLYIVNDENFKKYKLPENCEKVTDLPKSMQESLLRYHIVETDNLSLTENYYTNTFADPLHGKRKVQLYCGNSEGTNKIMTSNLLNISDTKDANAFSQGAYLPIDGVLYPDLYNHILSNPDLSMFSQFLALEGLSNEFKVLIKNHSAKAIFVPDNYIMAAILKEHDINNVKDIPEELIITLEAKMKEFIVVNKVIYLSDNENTVTCKAGNSLDYSFDDKEEKYKIHNSKDLANVYYYSTQYDIQAINGTMIILNEVTQEVE
ncbi:MAG: hypothetical protein ACEPOV_11010 [Hyphomicrobiales bacterium]